MSSLRELQRDCYRALLHEQPDALLPRLSGDLLRAATGMRVYQSNAQETFQRALASAYPVIERLVGDACFASLAALYMREHPSGSGDLQSFGNAFPRFLEKVYRGSRFDYLPDVAGLEQAIEAVLVAPEGAARDAAELARFDPLELPQVVLEVSPAAHFVDSRHPILDIWRANQPGREHDVDLAAGPQAVVIRRRANEAELRLLEPDAAGLARAVSAGHSLDEACATLARSADFDLARALGALLSHGYLNGYCADAQASAATSLETNSGSTGFVKCSSMPAARARSLSSC